MSTLTIEQLLTSDLFSLFSTDDPEIEADQARAAALGRDRQDSVNVDEVVPTAPEVPEGPRQLGRDQGHGRQGLPLDPVQAPEVAAVGHDEQLASRRPFRLDQAFLRAGLA